MFLRQDRLFCFINCSVNWAITGYWTSRWVKKKDTCPQKPILPLYIHRTVLPLAKCCSNVHLGGLCQNKLDMNISTTFRQANCNREDAADGHGVESYNASTASPILPLQRCPGSISSFWQKPQGSDSGSSTFISKGSLQYCLFWQYNLSSDEYLFILYIDNSPLEAVCCVRLLKNKSTLLPLCYVLYSNKPEKM